MKVIAFPFAGGNKYSFSHFFSKDINKEVIEYSGRGKSSSKECFTDVNILLESLKTQVFEIVKSCDEYIIYGHSMGALIGYLLCVEIAKEKLQKPLKLVVSGAKAPSYKRNEILHHLPDDSFLKKSSCSRRNT